MRDHCRTWRFLRAILVTEKPALSGLSDLDGGASDGEFPFG